MAPDSSDQTHSLTHSLDSPTNLGLQEVAIAVDLGDAGRALRAAAAVDTSGLSAERQARLLIEMARAHAQRRQAGQAVTTLLQAEQITPELVRGHVLVPSSSRTCSPCRTRPAPSCATWPAAVSNRVSKE